MRSRCPELAIAAAILACLSACSREARRFEASSQDLARPHGPYEYNAFAISEGKRLYEWFNCSGCHAHGGGAIGPALMDDNWIYGAAPENIRATLLEGRPNGMPAFRGRIPDQQLWQIVAYVRSMSGQVPQDAAPSRADHLFPRPSEQSMSR